MLYGFMSNWPFDKKRPDDVETKNFLLLFPAKKKKEEAGEIHGILGSPYYFFK